MSDALPNLGAMTRRSMLLRSGAGLGAAALARLEARGGAARAAAGEAARVHQQPPGECRQRARRLALVGFASDMNIKLYTHTAGPVAQRVWIADNVTGLEKLHAHLGDGVFENSHATFTRLFANARSTPRRSRECRSRFATLGACAAAQSSRLACPAA